jgi:hypothetical protein
MPLSTQELQLLQKACDKLEDGPDYRCTDYVSNVLLTALDFQMQVKLVNNAMEYFDKNHDIRNHQELRKLANSFACTQPGNTKLANNLWNNNHWSRAKFLRMILDHFDARGIRDQPSLKCWVNSAIFERDVERQFKTEEHSIGYTIFQWLRLRVDIDTIKPDLHLFRFVSDTIGRDARPDEAVDGLTRVARKSRRDAYRLDSAVRHYQHDKSD